MSLRELDISNVYDSEHRSLIDEFYIPVLSCAVRYDRAVGFFTSHALVRAAQGISALLENGGHMRLIVGAVLDATDFEAVKQGHELRSVGEIIQKRVNLVVNELASGLPTYRYELLCWLVATGRLSIKFAFRERGMYHEKIGIVADDIGNEVVFQGSANESEYALLPDRNLESFSVYKSWEEEIFEAYGKPYADKFKRLWDNKVSSTAVFDVPSETYELMEHYIENKNPPSTKSEKALVKSLIRTPSVTVQPHIPDALQGNRFDLKPHQRQALDRWKKSDFSGILKHATGSGKTITAIYGAVRIYEAKKRIFLVVAVPYQNLADQWVDNLRTFGFNPHRCYRSKATWLESFESDILAFNAKALHVCAAVVVNDTLSSNLFQSCLARVSGKTLVFIGDECHHHTTKHMLNCLPPWTYRLGLSATPFSPDKETNRQLIAYYGDVADTYDLERAIKDGVLCHYQYLPHIVRLTSEEAEDYTALSNQLAPLLAAQSENKFYDEKQLTYLLITRARIIASATQKIDKLREILAETTPRPFTLFYCGDGYTNDEKTNNHRRQIEMLSEVLNDYGWRSSRFTAQEPQPKRRAILDSFASAVTHAMVAIRVLDEGIDIPDCRTAYLLASSRNPRQFIQRRGRILRIADGKRYAQIHDFLVLPPESHESYELMTGLVRSELERAIEFARLAENRIDVHSIMDPIANAYSIPEVVAYMPPQWDKE